MADIFISWSKDRSLQFAKALRELMAQVLRDPEAKPRPEPPGRFLVTLSEDLPKGGNWFQHLAGLLIDRDVPPVRRLVLGLTLDRRDRRRQVSRSGRRLIRCRRRCRRR